MIFNTNVETSPLRRRASRILAIAVPPRRKTRELVLTDRRLLCIKPKFGRHTVRYEFSLKPPQKEKYHLTGVEPKGDKEFVVLTVGFLLFIYSIVVVTSLIWNEIAIEIAYFRHFKFRYRWRMDPQDPRSHRERE